MESPKEEIAQASSICVEELVDQVFEDQGLAKVIQELFSEVKAFVSFCGFLSPDSRGYYSRLLHGPFFVRVRAMTPCCRPG